MNEARAMTDQEILDFVSSTDSCAVEDREKINCSKSQKMFLSKTQNHQTLEAQLSSPNVTLSLI